VAAAVANAEAMGATPSCDPGAGALLAALACAVPPGGRILELGTGAGVGLSWIVEGVAGRTDVEVVSVESSAEAAAVAAWIDWPGTVRLEVGDALDLVAEPEQWDLVVAGARRGTWVDLADTTRSLRRGGLLLVDGLVPSGSVPDEHRRRIDELRRRPVVGDEVLAVEISWSSGLLLCARRHDVPGPPGGPTGPDDGDALLAEAAAELDELRTSHGMRPLGEH
jgi:demethylmenaquinone methyltransferase/2-methoxy-6-polyprenyl-1,4-benzoquinol methylase